MKTAPFDCLRALIEWTLIHEREEGENLRKRIPITGFNPERYIGSRIWEIPLSVIYDPGPKYLRSPARVKQYAKMLKQGKVAPPIELMERISVDGTPLRSKHQFDIDNGVHRFKAAELVGRKTILAVVSQLIPYEPYDDDEYADCE